MKRTLLMLAFAGVLLTSWTAVAQDRPDFSGTWQWVSRAVPHPLTIQQTADELIIESLGLSQGNPANETFRLDGSAKTMIYDVRDFWRKQETTARWDGNDFIGTVLAKAGWKESGPAETISLAVPHTVCTRTLRISRDGMELTIATSWYSPDTGQYKTEHSVDRFVRFIEGVDQQADQESYATGGDVSLPIRTCRDEAASLTSLPLLVTPRMSVM